MYWNATALLIGAALGVFSGVVWRRIVSRERSQEFYNRVGKIFHSMLTDPDANFLLLYKILIQKTLRFLGIQFLGVMLSLLPLIALFWIFGTQFHEWRNSMADVIVVHPSEYAHHLAVDQSLLPASNDGKVPIVSLPSKDAFGVILPGKIVYVNNARLNHAICQDNALYSFFLTSLGFTVSIVDKMALGPKPHFIILRPWYGDANPFWPYLSDPEFFLFLGMGFFSIPAMFLFRKKKPNQGKNGKNYSLPKISFLDYIFISITTAIPGLFRWIGDKETLYFKNDLQSIKIDRPIFLTGLARSGTTILLELLSSMPSVASHKYRDFPFVMMPILWQRFTGLFSLKNAPIERPHKDGILITRESPEAFEEPIWQYFFPHAHTQNIIHTIRGHNGASEFAKFFSDHIRKILFIRKGSRYLSKGNYNLMRIQYLATLFPDAKFVIPVRHPVEHVCSLVRQNKLFQRYNADDDRISDYLRAAGHYEFGPQRVPICAHEGTCQRILGAWQQGREHLGYAIQWADVYSFVHEFVQMEASFWDNRLFILRYEDLCEHPVNALTNVVDFCGLEHSNGVAVIASRVKPGRVWSEDLDSDVSREIWKEVGEVAKLFGYCLDEAQEKEWHFTSFQSGHKFIR